MRRVVFIDTRQQGAGSSPSWATAVVSRRVGARAVRRRTGSAILSMCFPKIGGKRPEPERYWTRASASVRARRWRAAASDHGRTPDQVH